MELPKHFEVKRALNEWINDLRQLVEDVSRAVLSTGSFSDSRSRNVIFEAEWI